MKIHKMSKFFFLIVLIVTFSFVKIPDLLAQEGGERLIRVAQTGQLIDSVNVWGDVSSNGRYLIPEDTKLPELISLSMGFTTPRGQREAPIGGKEVEYEIKVSRYDRNEQLLEIAYFRYRNYDPEPIEMFEFDLQNNDIITVQVNRVPTLTDYVRTIAPILGTLATSILLIERLSGD